MPVPLAGRQHLSGAAPALAPAPLRNIRGVLLSLPTIVKDFRSPIPHELEVTRVIFSWGAKAILTGAHQALSS